MKIILRIVGIALGCLAIYYQVMNFFFINLNRSSNDPKNYIYDDIAQLATIIILLAFTIYCLASFRKVDKS